MSQEVLAILKETDAFLEGHFLLSSGKHSDQYVQCAKLLRFPDAAAKVLAPVVEQLKALDIDKVGGPAMGGVIVSYFEWVQNLQSLSWSLEEVNNKLADILLKAFDEVYGLTEERGYPMRTSAYIIALRRLVKTKKIRGIFP